MGRVPQRRRVQPLIVRQRYARPPRQRGRSMLHALLVRAPARQARHTRRREGQVAPPPVGHERIAAGRSLIFVGVGADCQLLVLVSPSAQCEEYCRCCDADDDERNGNESSCHLARIAPE